jgi:hypothetical protein
LCGAMFFLFLVAVGSLSLPISTAHASLSTSRSGSVGSASSSSSSSALSPDAILSSLNITYPSPRLPFPSHMIQLSPSDSSQRISYRNKGSSTHKAQFKEDLFLYEHYFYGLTHGMKIEENRSSRGGESRPPALSPSDSDASSPHCCCCNRDAI